MPRQVQQAQNSYFKYRARLVEKVTKQGDEMVIPYEKYVLTQWTYLGHT